MSELPKIVIHNSISLDGSLTNFEPNMGLHYQIAGTYKPDAHLIGSNTIKKGIELYGDGVPPEEQTDFEKPKRDEHLQFWVIHDTTGLCKDCSILVEALSSVKMLLCFYQKQHRKPIFDICKKGNMIIIVLVRSISI